MTGIYQDPSLMISEVLPEASSMEFRQHQRMVSRDPSRSANADSISRVLDPLDSVALDRSNTKSQSAAPPPREPSTPTSPQPLKSILVNRSQSAPASKPRPPPLQEVEMSARKSWARHSARLSQAPQDEGRRLFVDDTVPIDSPMPLYQPEQVKRSRSVTVFSPESGASPVAREERPNMATAESVPQSPVSSVYAQNSTFDANASKDTPSRFRLAVDSINMPNQLPDATPPRAPQQPTTTLSPRPMERLANRKTPRKASLPRTPLRSLSEEVASIARRPQRFDADEDDTPQKHAPVVGSGHTPTANRIKSRMSGRSPARAGSAQTTASWMLEDKDSFVSYVQKAETLNEAERPKRQSVRLASPEEPAQEEAPGQEKPHHKEAKVTSKAKKPIEIEDDDRTSVVEEVDSAAESADNHKNHHHRRHHRHHSSKRERSLERYERELEAAKRRLAEKRRQLKRGRSYTSSDCESVASDAPSASESDVIVSDFTSEASDSEAEASSDITPAALRHRHSKHQLARMKKHRDRHHAKKATSNTRTSAKVKKVAAKRDSTVRPSASRATSLAVSPKVNKKEQAAAKAREALAAKKEEARKEAARQAAADARKKKAEEKKRKREEAARKARETREATTRKKAEEAAKREAEEKEAEKRRVAEAKKLAKAASRHKSLSLVPAEPVAPVSTKAGAKSNTKAKSATIQQRQSAQRKSRSAANDSDSYEDIGGYDDVDDDDFMQEELRQQLAAKPNLRAVSATAKRLASAPQQPNRQLATAAPNTNSRRGPKGNPRNASAGAASAFAAPQPSAPPARRAVPAIAVDDSDPMAVFFNAAFPTSIADVLHEIGTTGGQQKQHALTLRAPKRR